MHLLRHWSIWSLLAAVLSCGGDGANTFGKTTGGNGATGGAAGGGAAGKGNFLDGGGIVTTGGTGGTGGGGGFPEDAAICGGIEVSVETVPFNMLIMFDQSISMNDFLDGVAPPTRWDAVTGAFIDFFQSEDAKPLGIGLAYFEQIDPTTFATSCRVADYTTPEVEIGPMADGTQATRLINSMRSHAPTGYTPTAPALQGALNHAKAYTMAHPGRQTMVVFATDGLPTKCEPQETSNIGQTIAGPAFMGVPSIRTFILGASPPGELSSLSLISMAGGTGQPVFVSDPTTTSEQIRTAFKRLTRTNLACAYRIPPGNDGGRTDPGQVNVVIRPQGKQDRRLPLFNSSTSCGDGWYYDNPMLPQNIILCPETCSSLFNGEIRIVVGCAGPPPR